MANQIYEQIFTNKKLVILCVIVVLTTFVMLITFPIVRPSAIANRERIESSFGPFDYNQLINLNFSFKMLPLVCEKNDLLLLILVHTSADNVDKRRIIRETWAQNEDDIKILFLVGMVEKYDTQTKLEDENKQYGDMVQGSFLDTYHNLTYKHVMALKYALYHCSKVQFLLKVDDDVFVNIPNMKKFIQAYKCQNRSLKKIFCSTLQHPPVLREGKWEVSLKDYAETNYPTYCLGFAILYPYEILYPLYSEAQKTKFFWIDDVQVTGIVAKNSNIGHVSVARLVLSGEDVDNIVESRTDALTKPFLFGRINLSEKEIRSLWDFVVKHTPKAGILDYLDY